MAGANLCGADLRSAELDGARLGSADLAGALLQSAVYDEHTVWPSGFDADARGAIRAAAGANLRHRNLQGAWLPGRNLEHADLTGADLSHADFENVRLVEADLRDCNLDGARFAGADLRGADQRGARPTGWEFPPGVAPPAGPELHSHLVRMGGGGMLSAGGFTVGEGLLLVDPPRRVRVSIDLRGALYDRHTRWPAGFDAPRHGARLTD